MRRALLIAGNGFIGAPTAARLVQAGCEVTVLHTGSRPLPAAIRGHVVARGPSPIVQFPSALFAGEWDIVIHFLCYGAPDATAFVEAFDGRARRLALISSGDVYLAYGRLIGLEPGPPQPTPLAESAALRTHLYPYRKNARHERALDHWYEKIKAERAFRAAKHSEVLILRLPKVYGLGGNANLATVYGFRRQPQWRWTHGYVENVAAAIALTALHNDAGGETINLGEAETPTMEERLRFLPPREQVPEATPAFDFRQHMHMDTAKLRERLGFRDVVEEREAMRGLALKHK